MAVMVLKSSADRYGTMAIAIHWISAIAIIGLLVAGFVAADTAEEATKIQLLRFHFAAGIAVLSLTLFRIGWWLFADRQPHDVAGLPRWQGRSARIVHRLFYVVVIVLAVSGIGMMVLSGAGDVVFGEAVGLPDFTDYQPRAAHGIAGRLLVILVVLHVGAALYHHLVRRDGTLRRMLP